ncbi:MAG: hypothetical protein JXB88_15445 [Spirochaetales bacterium]|nr:hypothetical protein [Spirochaetales bacterium]
MHKTTKGRILAVKSGYNPNSSSIGSQIHLFILSGLSAGSIALAILHIVTTFRMKIDTMESARKDKEEKHGQKPADR